MVSVLQENISSLCFVILRKVVFFRRFLLNCWRLLEQIGSGRFSTVHMGNWHGDVAIKFLDMENLEDETTLEAFRLDVATFRWALTAATLFL